MSDHLRETLLLQLIAALATEDSSDSDDSSDSEETETHDLELPDYLMVAAIDFGTTFSGYAFSFKTSQRTICMNKNWGAGIGTNSYKTPTCLLCDPDGKFVAFGFDAQQKYADMIERNDMEYYFFERFKMKLHSEKHLNEKTEVMSINGKRMAALDVFAMSLNYLKNHLVEAIKKQTSGTVDTDMIRWVITVPAIWSDASKQFMRQAAFKAAISAEISVLLKQSLVFNTTNFTLSSLTIFIQADMIDTEDSKKLVIALEPEAASLYVRHLEIDKFVSVSANTQKKMVVGTKYLVVDAGGGTLDVTAHELIENDKIKELHYASGGPYGGIKVDEAFIYLMKDIFGSDFIDVFQNESASQWLQMICDFERKKRSVKQNGSLNMGLPWNFGQAYQKKKGDFAQAVSKYNNPDVKFANGMLTFMPRIVDKLFTSVVDGIINHISSLLELEKLKDIQYIFCVGGFCESALLHEAINSKFKNRAVVLVPEEASLAVVKGAVEFGHGPDVIASRIAAKTYGVDTWTAFQPFIHKPETAIEHNGKLYCKDKFEIFVKKGDEVPLGYTHTSQFSPVLDEQDSVNVGLYSIDRPDVMYITDDGVEHHGDIEVEWPGSGTDRKMEVSMIFGGTEIQVSAVTQPGGNKAETTINFFTE